MIIPVVLYPVLYSMGDGCICFPLKLWAPLDGVDGVAQQCTYHLPILHATSSCKIPSQYA